MQNLLIANHLSMERCPHCHVSNPLLVRQRDFDAITGDQKVGYSWRAYACSKCAKAVLGGGQNNDRYITMIFPSERSIEADLPPKAAHFLKQAIESLHAPSGAIMLSASAVDAMLKGKGLKTGSLYARIAEARAQNLITPSMETWAHQVRLDANDERHADETADLPTEADASRSIELAEAFGDFLFVLPARVARGLATTVPQKKQ